MRKPEKGVCDCGRSATRRVIHWFVCERCYHLQNISQEFHEKVPYLETRSDWVDPEDRPPQRDEPEVQPGRAGLVIHGAYRDYGL